jgi:myo-inositol-1(or 4)-monophosphatase
MTEAASALMDMRLLAAQAIAREAGAMARRRFLDRSFAVKFKGPQDYLTEVDGETEAFIAERLTKVFPTDGFIGEESQARPAGAGGAVWVVDPIDGTANFARGVPHFCVSIACVADDRVEVGVIYNPMLDELFAARRGGGARLNGAPISASHASSLAKCSVEVGWNSRAGFAQYIDLLTPGRVDRRLALAHRFRARSPSPMSRPDGPTALSSIISTPGTVSLGSCW